MNADQAVLLEPVNPTADVEHPLGANARVLLTSVFGPYAQDDEYGSRRMNPFLVGVSSFAALGLALASLVSSASAASAAANATLLPLAFVSDVFVVTEGAPDWLLTIGDVFPLKPFVNAFQDCFNPLVEPPAFNWGNLARVAAWGAVGAVIAVRNFSWEPSGSAPRGRRSRQTASAG